MAKKKEVIEITKENWQKAYDKFSNQCDTVKELMEMITPDFEFEEKVILNGGERFRYNEGEKSEQFILAKIDDDLFCLVSLKDGNRWIAPCSLEKIREELNLFTKIT